MNAKISQMPKQSPLSEQEQQQLKQLLTAALRDKKTMASIAEANPRFNADVVKYWNGKWKIFPTEPRKDYDEKQKLAVIAYAEEHGVNEAARIHDIPKQTIIQWKKDFAQKLKSVPKEYSPDEIIKFLQEAQDYNNKTKSFGGMVFVINKYKIGRGNFYKWNEIYKIVKTKPMPKSKKISLEQATTVMEALAKNKGVLGKTSRQTGYSIDTVRNIAEHFEDYTK
jgi:transposase-like protein